MIIKDNINDYNLDDFPTCKNLAYELHSKNKTLTKDNNVFINLLTTKDCTKHHWFNDIDKAYNLFDDNLKNDKAFYDKWFRPSLDDLWIKGAKDTTPQLRAFFVWYVDDFGGQAVPF